MSHEALISPIREWLIDEALGDSDITELFDTLCLRISSVGIPITRARLFWPTLHPLFQAETVSLLEGLEKKGFTDFIAMGTDLEGTSFRTREGGADSGIMVTWSTNAPNCFSDDDLLALQKIQRRFAVACKVMIQARISSNIAHTYLGSRAGSSVMDGQIRRGDGQTTNAVIWYSDLRDSTQLAESMPAQDYYCLLNSYFTATAQPIIDNGGEILDQFRFGVGVNVGEVMFGNIGIPSRLSFSVIGSAVNEAARIEALTKKLKRQILVGKSFADISPKEWKSLGEHKLQGVAHPIEIFDYSKD